MTVEEDKIVPSTWIPWIMALAVVFGWSAFAPDPLTSGKEKPQDGIGLLHQADELPAPGVTPHPLAGLLPDVFGRDWHWGAPPVLLGVEVRGELPFTEARPGGVQGRAPPSQA